VESETQEGRFRQDLLYRLNAVTLHLPPLRERREDIRPLVARFTERVMRPGAPPASFSREAISILESYHWPGNIRELENAVARAVALCDGVVRPQDLPERIRHTIEQSGPDRPDSQPKPDSEAMIPLSEIERRHIVRVLARTGGNKQAAARILGIDRTTLQRMLKRYQLEIDEGEGTGASGISFLS